MTVDLTKNTTPWGLLDEETKAAFDAWDGDSQVWHTNLGWQPNYHRWFDYRVYRTVPKPVVETIKVNITVTVNDDYSPSYDYYIGTALLDTVNGKWDFKTLRYYDPEKETP